MITHEDSMENQKDRIQWLEFDQLKPYSHVVHGVLMRHGGVSEEPYASLNVSNDVGDHADSVKINRERICSAFQIPSIVFAHQGHGKEVVQITREQSAKIPQCDALFTAEKNIALGITHADCQAAIFYDPKHDAVGVAHAGWRGSVQNVYANLIEQMKNRIGTKSNELLVSISPSLGPCHAEFVNYKQELPQEFWPFQVKPHYFDFWAISKMQLMKSGVVEKNIEIAKVCTYCSKDYYSHRRDHKTGRNTTIVVLKG